MTSQDYTTAFSVDRSAKEVFAAINNVREWWTGEPGVKGRTNKLGDEFTYQYGDFHLSRQKVTELTPGKRVVWLVLEGGPNFVKDKTEWKGTKVIFDIAERGNKTEVRFTHQGLLPRLECYDSCSDAWGSYVKGSLRDLITTGKAASNEEG